MTYQILAINPGSTSTKIGLYYNTEEILTQNISHSAEDIARFSTVIDQTTYRMEKINFFLSNQNVKPNDFAAVVGRGGLLRPMTSGTYQISDAMLDDLVHSRYGSHASNLGAILSDLIAKQGGCPSYIVDPVVVDELAPVARITGWPEITRKSIFHALNQKAVAKRFAKSISRPYESLNLIVAHLGGGISVGCHTFGEVVDVNNALDGDGPFSPERAGTLPTGQLAEKIITESLTREALAKRLAGQGGMVAYLGTNDMREVERTVMAGDSKATLIYQAMIYSIAKSIAAAAVAVSGKVDHIIITGGMAYSEQITKTLTKYIEFIAPVSVLPGENELQALAEGAYRVLCGEETAREY